MDRFNINHNSPTKKKIKRFKKKSHQSVCSLSPASKINASPTVTGHLFIKKSHKKLDAANSSNEFVNQADKQDTITSTVDKENSILCEKVTTELDLTIEQMQDNETHEELVYDQESFSRSFLNNVDELKKALMSIDQANNELYQLEDDLRNDFSQMSDDQQVFDDENISFEDLKDDHFPTHNSHECLKSDQETSPALDLSLESLGLPEHMVNYHRSKGVNSLMQWQYEALHLPGVLDGKRNLIFSAPTSAGKTIVADILLIRSIRGKQKKGLIILPYISLANEKVIALEAMIKYSNIEVGAFMGNSLPSGRFPRVDIAVCTIEKANNIINRLIEEKKLDELGIVVIDELHELGMSERGSILEQTLCKIKYSKSDIQIIAMSATLPNLEQMADWLDSACYRTDYRPIPLKEMIVNGNQIIDAKTCELIRKTDDFAVKVGKDRKLNLACTLALETMLSNKGVLVFCESKKVSETLADSLTDSIKRLLAYQPIPPEKSVTRWTEARDKLNKYLQQDHLQEIIAQLSKCPSKLDDKLANTLPYAIAFHHAGLSMDERDILECGFKKCSIKVLFATPTLSSGVNLPAHRVVINKAQVGIDFMNSMVYRQMTGRAGRKNIDTSGESFIIVSPGNKDEDQIKKLINSPLEPIKSKAIEQDIAGKIILSESFRRLTLESIATGMLTEFGQIKSFLNTTFFAHQIRPLTDDEVYLILDQLTSTSEAIIQRLVDKKNQTEHYVASKLGQGIIASSFPPDEALRLKRELESAMNALCIKSNLHLLYYVIPSSKLETKRIDWQVFLSVLSKITEKNNESVSKVMELLDINIGFIIQQTGTKDSRYTEAKGKYIKFFYTLALNEIMKERSLKEVCSMFKIDRGELQSLQQRSSSYAGMLSIFCKKLGWDMLSSIIKIFQDRLYFGISQELIELMNITCLNAQMARCLYDEGFVDVKTIARSNELEIEKVLVNRAPENPNMRIHWVSNRFKSLSNSEISELIVNEARCVIEEAAGGKIMWKNEKNLEVRLANTSMDGNKFASQANKRFGKKKARVKYVNDNLSQIQSPSRDPFDSSQNSTASLSHMPEKRSYELSNRSPTRKRQKFSVEQSIELNDNKGNQMTGDDQVDYESSPISVANVKGTCLKLNDKLFYNSSYDQQVDEECFETVDFEASKIRDEINRKLPGTPFEFHIRTVNNENMDLFIKRLRTAHTFLFNFKLTDMIVKEKNFVTNEFRSCQDTRVTTKWLNKIDEMCFMFESKDQKIYYLESNDVIQLFKAKLKESKFEFANRLVTGICFDAKVGYKILKSCVQMSDENLRKIYWHDPKVAHWLLNPDAEEPHNFLQIASYYIDTKNGSFFEEISKSIKKNPKFEIFSSILLIYPVMSTLKRKLTAKELYVSYINVELPVLFIFAKMELNGFTLDVKYLKSCIPLWISLNNQLDDMIRDHLVKNKIRRDKPLNVRDHQEVKNVFNELDLYNKLVKEFNLDLKIAKSLGTGKEVLDKMRTFEPFAGWISDSRKLLHLIDSHSDLTEQMKLFDIQNKVIGTYKHFMATGRIAMFNPNLLGIDRDSEITIGNRTYQLSLKRAIKASPGYLLVTADYCQLELRLLAVLSQDQNLIEVFKVNKDPFILIAARIKNKNPNDVTQIERNIAKQLTYAIIYGQGLRRVAETLDVRDEKEAEKFLEEFHQAFPNLNKFIEESKAKARGNGFIETLFGRRRYLPEIHSSDTHKKASNERKAVNSRIQGSASDLVKLTMLKIDQTLVKSKVDVRILLQIHDELIFEVKDEEESIREFIRLLIQEMEGCESVLKVKLPIKVQKGFNWSEIDTFETSPFK